MNELANLKKGKSVLLQHPLAKHLQWFEWTIKECIWGVPELR